jgi:hypothetical protein
MTMLKRFITEYRNVLDGGARYAGPRLEADSLVAAQALTCCVFGPSGERLTVLGEIVDTVPAADGGLTTTVRKG